VIDVELLVSGEDIFELLFLRVAAEEEAASEAEVGMVLMVVPQYEERRSDRNVGPECAN
jgi:hypothetical protein